MGLGQGHEFGIEHQRNGQPADVINRSLDFAPQGENIGIIYGNISTMEFKFAVSVPGVTRTGYVQVWHETHGWVLGQIIEMNLESKLTYTKAQQISKEYSFQNFNEIKEPNEFSLTEELEPKVKGKLAALVSILGFRDKHNVIQLPSSPFSAGQPVYHANNALIRFVLGLEAYERKGAYIGLLRNHQLKVYLDINELVQKHVSVIAKTGSGKSYMVGILVEELLKRKIPIIILDPHGEYSGLMHPNIDEHDTRLMSKFEIQPQGYSDAVQEYSVNPNVNQGTLPLKLPSYGLSPDAISELMDLRGSGVQSAIMFKAINRLTSKKGGLFTLDDLIHVIELDRNSSKWHLVNNIENLISTGIFSPRPTRLTELVQPGRATIINLRGLPPINQQITVTHLARQLFEARKLNRIPAMMLVVEEAHQFCPQQGRARSSNILKTIASEGRKFGLGMTVVTQRPALVDKNVLSQCNTQIILKVTNPNDLKALVSSVEGLNNVTLDEIQRLPISVAILVGSGIQLPIFVDVRVRETKHGGRPVDIFSNVETFYSTQDHREYGGYFAEPEHEHEQEYEHYEPSFRVQRSTTEQEHHKYPDEVSVTEHMAAIKNTKKSNIFPEELLARLDQRLRPKQQLNDNKDETQFDQDDDIDLDDQDEQDDMDELDEQEEPEELEDEGE